jgi:hypothetical protein
VGRDHEIEAIVEIGRQTRKPNPRWLWFAATLVGVACGAAFLVVMLGTRAPVSHPAGPTADRSIDRPPGRGLGIALGIGAGAAVVIGFSIARQRRRHSSRNSP